MRKAWELLTHTHALSLSLSLSLSLTCIRWVCRRSHCPGDSPADRELQHESNKTIDQGGGEYVTGKQTSQERTQVINF